MLRFKQATACMHSCFTHFTCREQGALSAWEWKNSEDALKAYTAFLGFLALGQIPAMRQVKYADLPYFIGLASMTIYIGAHRGLCTKVRQQISIKEVSTIVVLSACWCLSQRLRLCVFLQGALAPFAASAALFAGYLLVKFFPQLNVQAFLNAYFWLIGSIAIFGALQSPLRLAVSLAALACQVADICADVIRHISCISYWQALISTPLQM